MCKVKILTYKFITIFLIITLIFSSAAVCSFASAGYGDYASFLFDKGYGLVTTGECEYKLIKGDTNYPLPVEFKVPAGVLATMPGDFDGDGADECLAIIGGSRSEEYGIVNHISAVMMKKERGRIVEVDSCELLSGFMFTNADTGYGDVFVNRKDGKIEICCETYDFCGTWADGLTWMFSVHTFDGGKIVKNHEFYSSGSDFDSDEIKEVIDEMAGAGFAVAEAFDRVSESGTQYDALFTYEYGYNGTWDDFFDIVYGGGDNLEPMFLRYTTPNNPSSGAAAGGPAGGLSAPSVPATASPTASRVLVDGVDTAFDAYSINDFNYFKLRDLAFVLNGSPKQFGVGWDGDKNAISLTNGAQYVTVGGEMTGKGAGAKTAVPTDSIIYLDGAELALVAYTIEGNNYFKLRDIGEAFNFSVEWDEAADMIVIDTSSGYAR